MPVNTCSSTALNAALPRPSMICCRDWPSCASISPSASTKSRSSRAASAAPMVLLPLPGMPINEMILSLATVIGVPFHGRVTPCYGSYPAMGHTLLRDARLPDTQCNLSTSSVSFVQRYSYAEGCVTDHRATARRQSRRSSVGGRIEWLGVASVRPVALGLELLGEVLHLVCQDPLFSQIVPLEGVGPKWYSE